ncbi:lysylphosphatidylglycerol synthase transmembrane domain-containing protein [Elusimicrobiota bacterium]
MKKNSAIVFKILVSSGLIVFLFYKIGISKVISTLSQIQFIYLFPCFIFMVLTFILPTYSMFLLIRNISRKVRFRSLFSDMMKTAVLTIVTPGRIGQFYIIKLMGDYGITPGASVSIFFINKILNYIIRILIAMIAVFMLFFDMRFIIVLFAGLLVIFIGIFLLLSDFFREWIKKIISNKILKNLSGLSVTSKELLIKRKKNLLLVVSIKIVERVLIALFFYVIFYSYHESISFTHVFLLSNLVSVVSSVPLTLDGIGVREGAGVFLYSYFGVTESVILSAFLLFYIFRYVLSALLFGLFSVKKDRKIF